MTFLSRSTFFTDSLTGLNDIRNEIYSYSKAILTHRNGTYYEDLYLINGDTGKFLAKGTNAMEENIVSYSKKTDKLIKEMPNTIISIHNHGTNNPPTGSDLVSSGYRKYKLGIIACHNGDVFTYKAGELIFRAEQFGSKVDKFKEQGYNENDSIIKTLEIFERDYNVSWEKIE